MVRISYDYNATTPTSSKCLAGTAVVAPWREEEVLPVPQSPKFVAIDSWGKKRCKDGHAREREETGTRGKGECNSINSNFVQSTRGLRRGGLTPACGFAHARNGRGCRTQIETVCDNTAKLPRVAAGHSSTTTSTRTAVQYTTCSSVLTLGTIRQVDSLVLLYCAVEEYAGSHVHVTSHDRLTDGDSDRPSIVATIEHMYR